MLSEAQLFLTGLGVGLIVAAPVGPVNILAIQCALERGFLAGFIAGTGAVFADGLLAFLAASGVTYIAGAMNRYRLSFQLIGGLILLLFGLRLVTSAPQAGGDAVRRREADGLIVPKTFFLTMTNPGAVIGMFALVGSATSAVGAIGSQRDALILSLAVMAGSLVWWLALAGFVSRIADQIGRGRAPMNAEATRAFLLLDAAAG